jgi:hypothetical protein
MLLADEGLSVETMVLIRMFGALIAGLVFGLWPLNAGAQRGRPGLGIVGLVACVVSGFVFGCLLALPVAVFFRLLIGALGDSAPPGGPGLEDEPYNPYKNGKRSAF